MLTTNITDTVAHLCDAYEHLSKPLKIGERRTFKSGEEITPAFPLRVVSVRRVTHYEQDNPKKREFRVHLNEKDIAPGTKGTFTFKTQAEAQAFICGLWIGLLNLNDIIKQLNTTD